MKAGTVVLRARKVTELRSALAGVTRRVFVANELRDTDVVIGDVEKLDGSHPILLVRIKQAVKK